MSIGEACKPVARNQELTDANDTGLIIAALAGNTQAFDILITRLNRYWDKIHGPVFLREIGPQ